jgi:Ca2+-binding EF-hand superfamily protein
MPMRRDASNASLSRASDASDPEKGRVGKPSVGWAEDDGEDPGVGSGSGVGRGGRGSRTGLSYVLARVNYVGDSYLSQAVYQTYALVVLSVVLTCGGGVAYHYLGDTDVSMFDGMWATFTWISTGILGSGLTPTSIQAKSCASVLVVLGILYFSIILGLVVEGVQGKMKALREGKSTVIEREHTVMLGWTEKSLLFIREIINANESEGGGVIVVLCHEGKEAMERELGLFLKKRDMKGTTVVFRQGSRLMIGDLDKVAVSSARSVVVLSDTSLVADKADAEVLQVILNLTNLDLSGHVVAEVRDKDNEALIHLIGRGNVETVVSHDIIGRLMLMSVRQPGLAEVYGSVLGFEGDEFYAEHWPELIGVKYKDVQLMLPDAIPIGVKNTETGAIVLNPRHDHVMSAEDELVVIAEDNDTYKPKQKHKCNPGKVPRLKSEDDEKEYILFAGWRRDLRDILLLLDAMCASGSEIHIMASVPLSDRDALLAEGGLEVASLKNIELVHHVGNTAMRRHLEGVGIERFTSCIVFADEEEEGDIMQSDSKCLATLLLIRDIQQNRREMQKLGLGKKNPDGTDKALAKIPIVTEILDPRTQQTIQENPEMRSVSDFLQSNDMVSKILAMVGEDRSVKSILDQLLAPRGASMACIPASRYALPGETLSFFQMASRCQEFGETLLGYLEPEAAGSGSKSGFKPPVVNDKDKLRSFCWDGYVCCLLTGGAAVEALMSSRSKYMDASFAKKFGLGLSSVLDVSDAEFAKLVLDAFRRFDDDGSGTLELDEIIEAFKTLPLNAVTEEDVEKKFREFDDDDSGALDLDEFSAMMRQLRAEKTMAKVMEVPEEEFAAMLRDTFQRFDDDGSGTLELDEIVRAFEMLPLKEISEDEVRAKFTRFDEDKSGALDFEEFSDLMRELRKESAVKSHKKRPRLDNVERKSVRNIVNMAEVQLTRLPAEEREAAMAQILAFANSGEVVIKTAPRDEGDHAAAADEKARANAASAKTEAPPSVVAPDAEKPPSPGGRLPRARPSAADSPRDEWHRGDDAAARTSGASSSSLPPLAPRGVAAGIDSAREVAPPPPFDDRGAAVSSRSSAMPSGSSSGGIVVAGDRIAPRYPSEDRLARERRTLAETGEYAEYLAERLGAMSAMRRNQVVQIVDMLADAFALGQSVPATRLLGVISSFQAFPGGVSDRARGGGGGGAERHRRGASGSGDAGEDGRGGGLGGGGEGMRMLPGSMPM